MRLFYTRMCSSLALATAICSLLLAQAKGPHIACGSVRGFVEGFYSWYVPRALNQDTAAGWNETLRLIRRDISNQLAKLLAEDAAAQASCSDLVGLDFDPFLYTQEPAEKYDVGGVVPKGAGYQVKIYRVEGGTRAEKPDVVAEISQKDGHWVFVDFDYPGGSDLLTVLKSRPRCTRPRAENGK